MVYGRHGNFLWLSWFVAVIVEPRLPYCILYYHTVFCAGCMDD